jgi:hypothetical protein
MEAFSDDVNEWEMSCCSGVMIQDDWIEFVFDANDRIMDWPFFKETTIKFLVGININIQIWKDFRNDYDIWNLQDMDVLLRIIKKIQ